MQVAISPLRYGAPNEIVLRADNASREDVIPANHNLFGVYGGIYRPVSPIVTDSVNITPMDSASSGVCLTAVISLGHRLNDLTAERDIIYDEASKGRGPDE